MGAGAGTARELGQAARTCDTLTDGFTEYAKLPGTLIFLMGLSNLESIVERLLENGKAPDTPAAVVTNGTLPSERCVRGKLSELPGLVRAAELTSPGIIVVGQVADFHMKCEIGKPLSGVSVAVTGTDAMYEKLYRKLSLAGASVSRAELSHVEPVNREALLKAVREIGTYSWVVFTSRNGVRLFFEAMKEAAVDFRLLAAVKFAVVGSGTGDFLKNYGFLADYKPEEYTTAALAEGLCREVRSGERVLIPRAVQGSKVLTETLAGAGIEFYDLPVYDIRTEDMLYGRNGRGILGGQDGQEIPSSPDGQGVLSCRDGKAALAAQDSLDLPGGAPDYITFESGSGVRGFFKEHGEEKRRLFEQGTCAVCIGAVTAGVLKEYGISRMIVAKDYTADGILEAMTEDRARRETSR